MPDDSATDQSGTANPAAATTTTSTTAGTGDSGAQGKPEEGAQDDKPLGEAGEKALEAFKTRARKAERELAKREERVRELEEKDKTELERAQGQIKQLEEGAREGASTVQQLRVQIDVLKAANSAGLVDPEAATKLLDWDAIEFEDGKPTNVDELLKELVEARPYLKSGAGKPQGEGDGGKGEAGGDSSFNDQVRAQYARH